jgi:predicted sulfurtransferase
MKTGYILSLLVVLSLAVQLPSSGVVHPPAATVVPVTPSGNVKMAHPEVPRITAEELKRLMDKKGEYVLLDVRDSYSNDAGHIEGAQNISFDANEDPTARGMMLMELPMKTLIVLYCD